MTKLPTVAFALLSLISSSVSYAQTQKEWDSPNAIPVVGARVEIKKQIEISVDVPGTLITLEPNERGEVVKKGQIVVEINKKKQQAELDELDHKAKTGTILIDLAITKLENTELNLQKMKDANTISEVFPDTEVREQELAVSTAKAELEKARMDMKGAELTAATKRVELEQYTRIAEFDGIVVDLHKKAVGASVRQGDPIMTIVNFQEMLVTLTVNPIYKARINVGDRVLVRPKAVNADGTISEPEDDATLFNTSSRSTSGTAIRTSIPQTSSEEEICVGRVSFVGAKRKSDADNSFLIECVVQNKTEGLAKYLLNEGSIVDAVILSP